MTVGEMKGYTDRFKNIISSSVDENIKNQRLIYLLDDLEEAYDIPQHVNKKFEEHNPQLMQLYYEVDNARTM